MANVCHMVRPSGGTYNTGNQNYYNAQGVVIQGANSVYITNAVNGAYFDADYYGITCDAFSNASISLTALQTSIQSTNLAVSSTQAQLTAYVSGQQVIAMDPDRLHAEGILFGSALVAACVIYGLKQVYRTLTTTREES